jgi:hypothetical protein
MRQRSQAKVPSYDRQQTGLQTGTVAGKMGIASKRFTLTAVPADVPWKVSFESRIRWRNEKIAQGTEFCLAASYLCEEQFPLRKRSLPTGSRGLLIASTSLEIDCDSRRANKN